jgi:hypothetical protein
MPHPVLQLRWSPQASETGFRRCLGSQWNIMHTSAKPPGITLLRFLRDGVFEFPTGACWAAYSVEKRGARDSAI